MKQRTVYAVLGMLLQGPRSGYDLKKEFERQVAHFWSESVGQIYPALKQARAEGWVKGEAAPRDGRSRTIYTLTDAGRAALEAWFVEPPAPPPVRHELLLRTYFAARLDPALLAALGEHVAAFEEEQKRLRLLLGSFEPEVERRASTRAEAALWKLTLESGRVVTRARVGWCREARRVIARLLSERAEAGR